MFDVTKTAEDIVVWCLCELVRRAVASGCHTCEVKLKVLHSGVVVTCQDDCPKGIFLDGTLVDERAILASRRLSTISRGLRCTTAIAGEPCWRHLDWKDTSFVEASKMNKAKEPDMSVECGATRLEAIISLTDAEVASTERRLARFLGRVVMARAGGDDDVAARHRGELTVSLVRDQVVVARLSTRSFKRATVPEDNSNDDDARARRALVAYGKAMLANATKVVCVSASDSRARVTLAKFPPGSLFESKARSKSVRVGFVELIRIIDGEPLVDAKGGGKCALADTIMHFDGWGRSIRARFTGDLPFLHFSLETAHKRARDLEHSLGDFALAVETDGLDDFPVGMTRLEFSAECFPSVDANIVTLLRSCVNQLSRVFYPESIQHMPTIHSALLDMAANSTNPTFAQTIMNHPALRKILDDNLPTAP